MRLGTPPLAAPADSPVFGRRDGSRIPLQPRCSASHYGGKCPWHDRLGAPQRRPGRFETHREDVRLGTLVHSRLRARAVGVPTCGLAGDLHAVSAGALVADRAQRIHALPAGDEAGRDTGLDSPQCDAGCTHTLARYRNRRRIQSSVPVPAVLPSACRVRGGSHFPSAHYGLRDLCGRSLSGHQPDRWGRHRHCCDGGAAPARPDSRHVCGGRNCQRHRQLRASEVAAGRGARARPAA